jgi:hypothetical protein
MEHSIRKSFSISVTLFISLLFSAMSCTFPASKRESPTNPTANSPNASYDTKNALTNSQTSDSNTISPSVDIVMVRLDATLSKWAPENSHMPTTSLKAIWTESGKHPWKYYPKGVLKLMADVKDDDFFKNCDQAKNLVLMMFDVGGEIQTVSHLYKELYYCGANN